MKGILFILCLLAAGRTFAQDYAPLFPDTTILNAEPAGTDSSKKAISTGWARRNLLPFSDTSGMLSHYTLSDGTRASGVWGIGITGNAGTVTNGIYSTGAYPNPAWITSLAQSKISWTGTSAQYITGNGGLSTFPTNLSSFTNGPGYLTSASITSSLVTGALGYTPPNPNGTTAQYIMGNGTLATFPTNLSSFTNGPGYLTGITKAQVTGTGLAWQDVMNNGATSTTMPSVNISSGGLGFLVNSSSTTAASQIELENSISSGAQLGLASSTTSLAVPVPENYGYVFGNHGVGVIASIGSIRFGSLTTEWGRFDSTAGVFYAEKGINASQITNLTTNGFLQTTSGNGTLTSATLTSAQVTTALGYSPPNANGTTAQYIAGNGTLATFPTNLSSFTNGPGYLTSSTGAPVTGSTNYIQNLSPSGSVSQTANFWIDGYGFSENSGSSGDGFGVQDGVNNRFWFNAVGNMAYIGGAGGTPTAAAPIVTDGTNVTLSGYLETQGQFYHRNNLNVLSKSRTGWITWATRDTSGSESVIDLQNMGNISASGTIGGSYIQSSGSGSGSTSSFWASSAQPSLSLNYSAGGTDAKDWQLYAASNTLVGRTVNDAVSNDVDWLIVTRSGITPTNIQLNASSYNLDGITTNGFLQTTSGNGTLTSAALTGAQVTTALGYTPPNPNGTSAQYIAGNGVVTTFPAIPTSANYIVNGTSQQSSANFNVSGTGTIGTSAFVQAGTATLGISHYFMCTNDSARWGIGEADLEPSYGSDKGSDFAIWAYPDNGGTPHMDMEIDRDSGTVIVYNGLSVKGTLNVTGTVNVAGSVVGSGSLTAAYGVGAGTASGSPTIEGTLQGGLVTIVPGESPEEAQPIVTITYSTAFPNNSYVTLTPANNATALIMTTDQIPHISASASGFSIMQSSNNVLAANTTYSWYFTITGR